MTKQKQLSTRDNLEVLHSIQEKNIDIEAREVWLTPAPHDQNDHEHCDVGREMAIQFEKNFRLLNQIGRDAILIHMHSGGGSWEDCMGIYDAIKTSESPTILLVYGEASSASGIILQAADVRVMMPRSYLLIHGGDVHYGGTREAFQATARQSQIQFEIMLDIFAERSTLSKGRIWDSLNAKHEWFLNPTESVEHGFADGILGTPKFQTISSLRTYNVQRANTG